MAMRQPRVREADETICFKCNAIVKRDVRLHCEVDASLLGGAIVRSGDMVIDGSLRAGLERLSRDIAL